MSDLEKILLGAIIGFIAARVGEYLKRAHVSRTASMMIKRELQFHKLRLEMAIEYDKNDQAQYELKFPSSIWSAHGSVLLAGTAIRKSEAILNWYASMQILGNTLSKRIISGQFEYTGPDRARLKKLLDEAIAACNKIAFRWGKRREKDDLLLLPD